MTSVAVCSAATGPHTELLDMSRPTLEAWAGRHGWDVYTGPMPDRFARPASWFKIIRIATLLDEYQTVIWVDADAVVVDTDRNILDAATVDRQVWMVMHRVPDGRRLPNCGVLVCHRTPRLCAFLDVVWEQRQWVDHAWWEQAAVLDLLGWEVERSGGLANPGPETEWSPLVGYLGTEWNSMPLHDPHPDPAIVHFSGMGLPVRAAKMREQLAAA